MKTIIVRTINWMYFVIENILYRFLFQKRPLYIKKYKLSLCGIFKNEAPFLKEWIDYHRLVGVEHFYLYNNNSSDNFNDILFPYIQEGIVTLIEWPYNQAQIEAYKNFYDEYRNETQWVSFLDIDEFIVPKKHDTILDWIKGTNMEKYPAILIYWKMFGTTGKMNHNFSQFVIEQYINSWESYYNWGKCILNTDNNLRLGYI